LKDEGAGKISALSYIWHILVTQDRSSHGMRRIVAELPFSASDLEACLQRDLRHHPKCRASRREGSRLM
jgi:hypothetical protein